MSAPRARPAVRRRPRSTPAAPPATATASDRPAVLAAGFVGLALIGAGLAVDVGAAASFDAPKRLVVTGALVAASACLLVGGDVRSGRPTGRRRLVGGAVAVAFAWTILATLVAPRSAIAGDGLRTLALFGLALPLGASSALAGERGRRLLACFLAVVALNALVALAQAAGLELFGAVAITGRTDTGGLLGNEGQLAQLTALALVAVVAVAIVAPGAAVRGSLVSLGVVLAAALVSHRNLTALVALACGVAIALELTQGRKALVSLGLVVLVLGVAIAIVSPLRGRVVQAAQAASHGDWDAVTTYRLGPWAAGLEMVRERPLTGFGPGTFGAEFTAHRLDAELRHERRFTIPVLTSSFGEAHSEYLQAAAEAGIPAALAVVGALGALQQRLATGRGCVIDCSLFESAVGWVGGALNSYLLNGTMTARHGTGSNLLVPYQVFETADFPVCIAAGNDRLFVKCAKAMGRPEWATDPRFEDRHFLIRVEASCATVREAGPEDPP